MDTNKIFKQLQLLQKKAYCPYSSFPVSSLIEIQNEFFEGVNIENCSYPNGICAERAAISNAIIKSNLIENGIDKIYLLSAKNIFILPCGMCLQVISEFVNSKTSIISFNNQGIFKEYSFEDLYPHYFKKGDLS